MMKLKISQNHQFLDFKLTKFYFQLNLFIVALRPSNPKFIIISEQRSVISKISLCSLESQ